LVQLIFSIPSTTFQNFPGISDLLPEASKFQHHKKPCSICSILLISSSNYRHKIDKPNDPSQTEKKLKKETTNSNENYTNNKKKNKEPTQQIPISAKPLMAL
jgi:hypothetical protein